MARAETQPVRLPSDLAETLRGEAERAGRSFPAEIEARLRDSLDRGAWSEVEPRLAPRPRALGRLLGFVANELTTYAPAGEETDYLQNGLARMLARLSGEALPGPEHDAETMADYWQLRLFNAKERTYENGATVPMTDEQRALAEIQADLTTGQAVPAEKPEEAMAGGAAEKPPGARSRTKRETA